MTIRQKYFFSPSYTERCFQVQLVSATSKKIMNCIRENNDLSSCFGSYSRSTTVSSVFRAAIQARPRVFLRTLEQTTASQGNDDSKNDQLTAGARRRIGAKLAYKRHFRLANQPLFCEILNNNEHNHFF